MRLLGVSLLLLTLLPSTFAGMILGGSSATAITKETENIANVAVQQLNTKANFPKTGNVKLVKIISAKKQVVAGTNHYITLETQDDAGKKTVEVQVWEKLSSNVKGNELPIEVTNFKILPGNGHCSEHWTKAAQQGVAQLNQRSNSLFPYQLVEVLAATPADDGSSHTELLVEVKRGDKQEKFTLTVKPSADDHYSLVKFNQQPAEAAAGGPASS